MGAMTNVGTPLCRSREGLMFASLALSTVLPPPPTSTPLAFYHLISLMTRTEKRYMGNCKLHECIYRRESGSRLAQRLEVSITHFLVGALPIGPVSVAESPLDGL